MNVANVDYDGLIPNNVALGQDVRIIVWPTKKRVGEMEVVAG